LKNRKCEIHVIIISVIAHLALKYWKYDQKRHNSYVLQIASSRKRTKSIKPELLFTGTILGL
jgi:hypothetical protein